VIKLNNYYFMIV